MTHKTRPRLNVEDWLRARLRAQADYGRDASLDPALSCLRERLGTRPLIGQVIEAYIARNLAQKTYLQKGDRVTIVVDKMGVLSNTIV